MTCKTYAAVILSIIPFVTSSCVKLVMDPSPDAFANDYTIISACESMPGRGADICHLKEGAPVDAVWTLILPEGKHVLGGELVVNYRDVEKTYEIPAEAGVMHVPFKDLIPADTWSKDNAGTMLARAKIRYQGNETEEIFRARGIAFLVVTAPEYDPLPIDSGFVGFSTNCRIQYSTSGRSAIECKP